MIEFKTMSFTRIYVFLYIYKYRNNHARFISRISMWSWNLRTLNGIIALSTMEKTRTDRKDSSPSPSPRRSDFSKRPLSFATPGVQFGSPNPLFPVPGTSLGFEILSNTTLKGDVAGTKESFQHQKLKTRRVKTMLMEVDQEKGSWAPSNPWGFNNTIDPVRLNC